MFSEVTGDSNVQIQKVAGSNQVIFKTRTLNEDRETLNCPTVMRSSASQGQYHFRDHQLHHQSEMKRDALIAVVLALILMLIYIWFRFKDMRFGASSVIALAHDVLVVLTVYALVRISVGGTPSSPAC